MRLCLKRKIDLFDRKYLQMSCIRITFFFFFFLDLLENSLDNNSNMIIIV